MSLKVVVLATALLLLGQHVHAGSVYLIDNKEGQYFANANENPATISLGALPALRSSILGVDPPSTVDAQSAQEVENLVGGNVFVKPRALLTVQLLGVSPDAMDNPVTESIARGRPVLKADTIQEEKDSVATFLKVVDAGKAGTTVPYSPLDHTAYMSCGDACVEEQLKDSLHTFNGNYTAGVGPLNGVLQIPAGGAPEQAVDLDLTQLPNRMFAAEIAALYHAGAAAAHLATEESKNGVAKATHQLDSTLWSLQGLKFEYGADSLVYNSALAAVAKVLGDVHDKLANAHGNGLATQISLIGDVPFANSLKDLVKFQAFRQRRSLLQAIPALPIDYDGTIKFQTRSAAILSFILVVVFLIAGCHCLTNMKFKEDSLLYSRAKME